MNSSQEPTSPLPLNSIDREFIFLAVALHECTRAKNALDEVERLAQIREIDHARRVERREWVSIFDNIRMALHFTGSVSRIFFPPRSTADAKARGERLRQLAGMAEDHPIRDRTLRHHIEHIDERLDAWTYASPRPFIGVVEMIIEEDMFKITKDSVEASCPVIYYEETRRVSAFGDDFDLTELKEVLDDVCRHIVRGRKAYEEEKRRREEGCLP